MAGLGSILGALLIALVVQRDSLWQSHAEERKAVVVYSSISLFVLGMSLVVVAGAIMSGQVRLDLWQEAVVAVAIGGGLTLLLGSHLARQLDPFTTRLQQSLPARLRRPTQFVWSYIYLVVVVGVLIYTLMSG